MYSLSSLSKACSITCLAEFSGTHKHIDQSGGSLQTLRSYEYNSELMQLASHNNIILVLFIDYNSIYTY